MLYSENGMPCLRIDTPRDAELALAIAAEAQVEPGLLGTIGGHEQALLAHESGVRALAIYGLEACLLQSGILRAQQSEDHPLHADAVFITEQPEAGVTYSEASVAA